ncbi:hypothetical protein C7B65_07445 [Phormidesmis priestleyi ULC007]|uniref:Peptidase S1 n=2 Tax=Phormidesmis priestleyi TaxID=268141 RepID=A0A2T1DIG9_9CYAN|nr:hypothetical protein C7B65_07445 [Phormidesmis priestleyi ULC007]PZO50146.1 MAG: hypothetical protein DCF14_12075 [Phormidesmis priestleyi]
MLIQRKRQLSWNHLLLTFTLFSAVPVLAQPANFGTLTLGSNNASGSLNGATGGSTSLPAIVSNSDRHDKKCLGFADPKPDHLLVLQKPFSKLRLKVNSGDKETTIVIKGSDNSVRCGDNSNASNKGAILEDGDWQAGTYQVWVGSIEPGVRQNYRLVVQGN